MLGLLLTIRIVGIVVVADRMLLLQDLRGRCFLIYGQLFMQRKNTWREKDTSSNSGFGTGSRSF